MTHSLKNTIAASAGLVALALLTTVAVAQGTGGQGQGGMGDRPSATQPAPGMGQGMMSGTMGQGMTGQQRMPCVDQGQQTTGPCSDQGAGQMPGQPPEGQAPMMEQQIPPLRQ